MIPGQATCGCCAGADVETPARIDNPPGQAAIAYRVGVHARFKESLLTRLSAADLPALHPARHARGHRFHDRAVRRARGDARRARLLPGAHRQRELPAHRHRAALDPGARAPDRLRARARRGRRHAPRVHAAGVARQRRRGGRARHDPRRHAGAERAGPGRAAAELRDRRSGRPHASSGTRSRSRPTLPGVRSSSTPHSSSPASATT